VPGSRLAARDAITPFWIHIFEIEVVRLEHMHIAIENLEPVSSHGLPSSFFLGAFLAGYCILPEPFSVNQEATKDSLGTFKFSYFPWAP
jgi:hypothetical protein